MALCVVILHHEEKTPAVLIKGVSKTRARTLRNALQHKLRDGWMVLIFAYGPKGTFIADEGNPTSANVFARLPDEPRGL